MAVADPEAPPKATSTDPSFGVYSYEVGATPLCHIYAADAEGQPMNQTVATELASTLSSESRTAMVLPLENAPAS
jgi:hypothetical protein